MSCNRLNLPTFGGCSEVIVVNKNFVLKIPKNQDLADVAPLLCEGITMWSSLRYWEVGKSRKVAVVGLGGLGHMAIKLADALGADVSLFSRSSNKIQDDLDLGADRVVISTDKKQMASVQGHFDDIVDTVPYAHGLNP